MLIRFHTLKQKTTLNGYEGMAQNLIDTVLFSSVVHFKGGWGARHSKKMDVFKWLTLPCTWLPLFYKFSLLQESYLKNL